MEKIAEKERNTKSSVDASDSYRMGDFRENKRSFPTFVPSGGRCGGDPV
jgi:hypothetical protein